MSLLIHPCSSPNFEPRKDGKALRYIVLHYTGSEAERSRDYLTRVTPGENQTGRVSAHYLVLEDGGIEQYVDENMRAWHAGAGYWQGETDMNSASIGIEMVNMGINAGCPDYPPEQIAAVIALCQDIQARHPAILPQNVIGHSDIAPMRKVDPGPAFPWEDLATAGVGMMPDMSYHPHPLPCHPHVRRDSDHKKDSPHGRAVLIDCQAPACAGVTEGIAGVTPSFDDLDAGLTRIGYDPSRPLITRIQAFTMHYDRQNIRAITGLDRVPDETKAKIIALAAQMA